MLTYQNENIGQSYSFRSRVHHTGYWVPPHIHEYSEVMYTIDGCMTMYIEGEKKFVEAGEMVYIFPNQAHEYTNETDCTIWCAVFSNDYLYSFFRLYSDKVPASPVIDAHDCTQMIDALGSADPSDVVRITGLLHLLFGELTKNTDFIERKGVRDSLYNRAINYISKNFCTDLTLGDMAKALGYHEKYLSSELHLLTHMNFRAFLSTYRVDHAKRLLRTTGINISEIALESGYSSINTFNRVFKENVGMTPSEYRRKKN